MARRLPDAHYEHEAHLHGPQAFQYRFGIAVGSAKTPPPCEPPMAHGSVYQYYADQYAKDVSDWVGATEVPEYWQGQLLIWPLGGQARKLFDGMPTHDKQHGAELQDGQGTVVRVSAVEFILGVLEAHFPVHEETRMLRTGLGFFKFMPRRGERPEEWFIRFDDMLEEANRVARLELSVMFQSWVLTSLLQLLAKKLSELQKDMHHRLPRDRREYVELQQAMLREKVLENNTLDLRTHARNVVGASGQCSYFTHDDVAEPRFLYSC